MESCKEACIKLLHQSSNGTSVNPIINHMFAGLSTFSFACISIVLFLMHWKDGEILGTHTKIGVHFFAGLVTIVADMSLDSSTDFRNIYIIVLVMLFGTLINIYGSIVFFQNSQEQQASLGFGNSSVSVIIFAITIPLISMEMFAAISSMMAGNQWRATEWIVSLFQKAFQAGIYHFSIQHKVPRAGKTYGASWYLKMISLFNFSMWVSSIADRDQEMLRYINKVMPPGLGGVVAAVYAALVIDYRLLCCLLFAELAIQVENWSDHIKVIRRFKESMHAAVSDSGSNNALVAARGWKGFAYMFGVIICVVQLLNASEYFHDGKSISPSVNLVGIFADVMIIIQGYVLICVTGQPNEHDFELSSKAIEIKVGLMGVCGLSYCILRFALSVMAENSPVIRDKTIHGYFQWISVKFFIRIIGILFQLTSFYRLSPSSGYQRSIRNMRICHFLVPSIMLCQLAVFINSVIDSYSYRLEEFVNEVQLSVPASAVYRIGEPLHLGFCLHMFFHFLNINNNLSLQAQQQQKRGLTIDEDQGGPSDVGQRLIKATTEDLEGGDQTEPLN